MSALGKGVLALILAALGQLVLSRYFPGLGETVDFFTILVIYYAVTRRRAGVMLLGTSAGLIQDLFTHTFLGMNAFKKTLVGYLMGTLGSHFVLNQPIPRLGILITATVLEAFTEVGLILVLGQHPVLPPTSELLRQGIGNGIVGSVIYYVLAKME